MTLPDHKLTLPRILALLAILAVAALAVCSCFSCHPYGTWPVAGRPQL